MSRGNKISYERRKNEHKDNPFRKQLNCELFKALYDCYSGLMEILSPRDPILKLFGVVDGNDMETKPFLPFLALSRIKGHISLIKSPQPTNPLFFVLLNLFRPFLIMVLINVCIQLFALHMVKPSYKICLPYRCCLYLLATAFESFCSCYMACKPLRCPLYSA